MTVCVAVRVNECIVFAADSATTLSIRLPNGRESQNVFRHGHKVFNLYKGLPIGTLAYGTGNIGRASVSMLMKDFRELITRGPTPWRINPSQYTLEEVTEKLRAFLFTDKFQKLDPAPVWSQQMGIYVGGYSSQADTMKYGHSAS